ncbi:MAG: CBS domain-containing protein [Spirochaetaceae bacterium]|nr:CBS domain-containing protein [Spirochaetaceae bacterium]
MNVRDRMTRNPFTVKKTQSVTDARELMKKEKIHRLPVIEDNGQLIGIITEKDILYASPSPASTLDVWEMTSLLANLKVEKVMTSKPVSCPSDTPVEEAARIMSDKDIGGLPVVEGDILVGIITESDLFEIFIELFASREKGVRLTALLPNVKGELANFAGAIRDAGGDIHSFGTVRGDKPTNKLGIVKVSGLSKSALSAAVKPFVQEIKELRDL